MSTQIPKEVYAYVVTYLSANNQTIPTVPPVEFAQGATGNQGNYLLKIKDNSPSSVIIAMSIGNLPTGGASNPPSMDPTKIVCTSDSTNRYVYVGGSGVASGVNPANGGIYRVLNDTLANPTPYVARTNTNGIFDVDENNKKLYYGNATGTAVVIKDMSLIPVADIALATVYTSITEIKVSPDGKKLLVAGTTSVAAVVTPIIDVYIKDTLGAWQLANRTTYAPNAATPTNVVVEIVVNKASTIAYAVNPVGTMVSSILLTGTYAKTDKLFTGYTPNSLQLKGTELYVADSSAARILKLNAVDLTPILVITPPYTPNIIPNKLALTTYEDALYVSPFASTDTTNNVNNWRIDVIDPVTGIDTRKSTYFVGLYNKSPIATFSVLSNNDISPTVPVPDDRLQDLNEAVCIITSKVFSSCKDKECLADVTTGALTGTPPYVVTNIEFLKAITDSVVITFINDGNNLSRVQFNLTVPYVITYTASGVPQTITGSLKLGSKDIMMYIPQTANNNAEDYRLIVETYTDVLDGVNLVNGKFAFTVGVYEIFKIAQDVQLYVPAFGYCPVPQDAIGYIPPPPPLDKCDNFLNDPSFPEDFFPFQYEHFNH